MLRPTRGRVVLRRRTCHLPFCCFRVQPGRTKKARRKTTKRRLSSCQPPVAGHCVRIRRRKRTSDSVSHHCRIPHAQNSAPGEKRQKGFQGLQGRSVAVLAKLRKRELQAFACSTPCISQPLQTTEADFEHAGGSFRFLRSQEGGRSNGAPL